MFILEKDTLLKNEFTFYNVRYTKDEVTLTFERFSGYDTILKDQTNKEFRISPENFEYLLENGNINNKEYSVPCVTVKNGQRPCLIPINSGMYETLLERDPQPKLKAGNLYLINNLSENTIQSLRFYGIYYRYYQNSYSFEKVFVFREERENSSEFIIFLNRKNFILKEILNKSCVGINISEQLTIFFELKKLNPNSYSHFFFKDIEWANISEFRHNFSRNRSFFRDLGPRLRNDLNRLMEERNTNEN